MPSNWTKYSKKDMEQLITLLTSEAVDEEQKENLKIRYKKFEKFYAIYGKRVIKNEENSTDGRKKCIR